MIDPALMQELRRGTLVLAVLSVLKQGEACGADVRVRLAQACLPIEEGALYPMLRRLESQSLLVSERRPEGSRLKRMYQLSEAGAAAHTAMFEQWRSFTESLVHLNGGNQ
ncbi:PadR family transcriptional regulator [Stenotrophomonas koreensis]|nr:PadR family transcriptional regulator [Stenotrophomonas koreensis]